MDCQRTIPIPVGPKDCQRTIPIPIGPKAIPQWIAAALTARVGAALPSLSSQDRARHNGVIKE